MSDITIHMFDASHILPFVQAFQELGWKKDENLFRRYLDEQQKGSRLIWVAKVDGKMAGYVTLKWQSSYDLFFKKHIPEIMDLNVLPPFRGQGVGTCLLDVAEKEAFSKSSIVGIGVGLYGGLDGGYGPAQKLYVKRGYIPDGFGVTYDYKTAVPGAHYLLDDSLILWLTKKQG